MSIFTGLYPQQHGVYPPSFRLSPAIETLPGRFSEAGFSTAGYTEGGYIGPGYGFERGFDEFSGPLVKHTTDIEKTLEKGLAFLRRLAAEERFFLFLHTYSIHEYEPPEPYASLFWPGEPLAPLGRPPISRVGHTQLYPEVLHVPLLILHPDRQGGRRVPELVQSVDIAPTLLELAGVPPLEAAVGRSLVPLIEGNSQPSPRAYAEVLESYPQSH